MELPTIPQFYTNKNILITGGSGFIGKVLIEKLLRSCPDIAKIYLLLREKKGKNPDERIKIITDLPLFDVLKLQNPESLSKLKIIEGDVKKLDLGLSPEDRNLLIDEINIVFHGAACVRFDDSLKDAVLLNTRGTREVVKLALEMKNLDVFIHLSTIYCNCDKKVIEERLYPPHADWKKTIEIAENVDRHTLNALTAKYIHPLPNTYTFTKSLAEHVVHDMCKGRIPAVIYRPSIVIGSVQDPFPGWIDNFNGPIGLFVGVSRGIVRTLYSNPSVIVDYVPVDMTVRAMLISSWKLASNKDEIQRLTPSFYNGNTKATRTIRMGHAIETIRDVCRKIVPVENVLWYPNPTVSICFYSFFFKTIFYQFLPAVMVDVLLKILGKKPMLMKIQRRIYVANMALSFFMHNEWKFVNVKTANLLNELLPSDVDSFVYKVDKFDESYKHYMSMYLLGARKYLLKEGEDLEKAKKHLRRMWIVAQVFNSLWYLGFFWLIFVKFNIMDVVKI